MQLREYQKKAVKALYSFLAEKSGNPIIALPTGTGKSLIIAAIIRLYARSRIIVLTHVKELIKQNYETTVKYCENEKPGIYSAGLFQRDIKNRVIFATIGSVYKKSALFGAFDLILIDECHLVSNKNSTMYCRFINETKERNPQTRVIGLSATPFRLKTGLLTNDGIFNDICYDLTSFESFNQLIVDDYLTQLVVKETDYSINTENIEIANGDFVKKELQKSLNQETITKIIIQEIIKIEKNRKHWLIFGVGIKHCENIAKELNNQGVKADFLHSKILPQKRAEIIDNFKKGEIKALVNVNILTTGFDYPDIDLIAVLRPTISPGLWVQMLGRGTRPAKDKQNCLILDFARNTERLGEINNVVFPNYTRIHGKTIFGRAPIKICKNCKTYNPIRSIFCIECGQELIKEKMTFLPSRKEVIAFESRKTVNILHTIYRRHLGKNGISSLRVDYIIDEKTTVSEWICLEHKGFAYQKACQWWTERSEIEVPATIDEALKTVDSLKKSEKLEIEKNGRYWRIIAHLIR